jgi:hypothetical protein
MRVLGLAVAGVLALAAPIAGHAVPGSRVEQFVPAPGIVKVWGGCGWGWHPVPGHWSRWRGGWVPPHCAPRHPYYGWWVPYDGWENPYGWGGGYGPYDDWGALSYPYWGWRGPSRGWGNP